MHITLLEDESVFAKKLQKRLEQEGYGVSLFRRFHDFTNSFLVESQIYLVDIGLPDGSGFDIIKWLRAVRGVSAPILIISGHMSTDKIIYGLSIGADDYITKPFAPEILMARIRAILRRPREFRLELPIIYGDIIYDTKKGEVRVLGEYVFLTHKELLLLSLFMRNQDILIGRDEIVGQVWGSHNILDVTDNTINVTLSKLKKKLGPSFRLRTYYNEGYILENH